MIGPRIGAIAMALLLCGMVATAAGQPAGTGSGMPVGPPLPAGPDTITLPVAYGYAILAAIATAGGAMAAVIRHMWAGLQAVAPQLAARDKLVSDRELAHQADRETLARQHAGVLAAREQECHRDILAAQTQLAQERAERLKDQERLLNGQRDILKETLVTCASITKAIEEQTAALERDRKGGNG